MSASSSGFQVVSGVGVVQGMGDAGDGLHHPARGELALRVPGITGGEVSMLIRGVLSRAVRPAE
jgi:hypothetical protein